jgi:hypothetical protein
MRDIPITPKTAILMTMVAIMAAIMMIIFLPVETPECLQTDLYKEGDSACFVNIKNKSVKITNRGSYFSADWQRYMFCMDGGCFRGVILPHGYICTEKAWKDGSPVDLCMYSSNGAIKFKFELESD